VAIGAHNLVSAFGKQIIRQAVLSQPDDGYRGISLGMPVCGSDGADIVLENDEEPQDSA
jgi:hypothetical protein